MLGLRESWGAGRITLRVILVVIVGGIGVVFAMSALEQANERSERPVYAGTWVREGSNGEDYFVLNVDGSYNVHVSDYSGSIQDESWGGPRGTGGVPSDASEAPGTTGGESSRKGGPDGSVVDTV